MVNPGSSTEKYIKFLLSLLDISNVDIGSTFSWVDYQAKNVATNWADNIDKTWLVDVLSQLKAKTQMRNIWPTEHFLNNLGFFFWIIITSSKLPHNFFTDFAAIYICASENWTRPKSKLTL